MSLFSVQKSQETTFEKYNEYLKQLDKKFNAFLSSINIEDLLSYDFEKFDIKPTPGQTKPKYTAGQCFEENINKLLGNVNVPCIESDLIKPMIWKQLVLS